MDDYGICDINLISKPYGVLIQFKLNMKINTSDLNSILSYWYLYFWQS